MAIVNERHTAAKPVQVDPKTGKPLPGGRDSPNPQSLDSNPENGGFFGSFFASKNKKKMAAMEPPPATLKASGTLSEREVIEVEVISTFPVDAQIPVELTRGYRALDQLILQHCQKNYDRYGTQGYYAEFGSVCRSSTRPVVKR